MIYICIPTHNEQQTVGVVLWKLRHVLTDFPRDYQLLVADDASTDKTADVLEPYTRVLPLTVIRSEERQGWAASLEMLLREAVRRSEYPKRDVIVTLQADFSEEPDDIVPLIKRLEAGADVAVGNKVSATKEPRTRRFARSLAGFFMRRQKWPEGVVTPFEGYRAYRLYSIRRALEDRAGARVLRHEGWAGHAELLRAVLPHARRVDVVDIDDRPDRLQRPRRERPFAAAMQVRVMASGAEPAGLRGVEVLDRIAETASRSRERAAVTAQSIQAGRTTSGTRTNGGRTRQGAGPRREDSRTRRQANGRSGKPEGEQRPRREKTQPAEARTRQKGDAARTARPRGEQPESGRQGRRQPRSGAAAGAAAVAGAAPVVDENAVIQASEGAAAPDAVTRPKRKRRRRKRSGQGAAQAGSAAAGEGGEDSSQADAPGGADAAGTVDVAGARAGAADVADAAGEGESGADGTAGAGVEKKRRRRGGRRGGRGRRKRTEGAGSGSEAVPAESGSEGAGGEPAAAERPVPDPVGQVEKPIGRVDRDQEL